MKCDRCNQFFDEPKFNTHRKKCPPFKISITNEKKCRFCVKQFSTPTSLKNHIKSVHELKDKFECYICNKSFGGNYLKRHLLKCHEIILDCHFCKRTFYTPEKRFAHFEKTGHTNEENNPETSAIIPESEIPESEENIKNEIVHEELYKKCDLGEKNLDFTSTNLKKHNSQKSSLDFSEENYEDDQELPFQNHLKTKYK